MLPAVEPPKCRSGAISHIAQSMMKELLSLLFGAPPAADVQAYATLRKTPGIAGSVFFAACLVIRWDRPPE